jgi:hypothetical protein
MPEAVEIDPYRAHRAPVPFKSWTGQRKLAALGTNSGSDVIPFQGWRTFKEAFAPELVERAIAETGNVKTVVDPFGGSGTTALAAQFLGAKPTIIEVNPFLADLIEAKITRYDFTELVRAYSDVRRRAKGVDSGFKRIFRQAPATFFEPGVNDRYLFSSDVASRFASYKKAIDQLQDTASRRLFNVLLAGISVSVSNAVVSGKGRRYRRNWQEQPVDPDQVDTFFERLVLEAIHDLRRFESRKTREYRLLRGDSRSLITSVGNQDLAVFSPPYPNSFDYTDVYNIELWMGGYLSSSMDNRSLRDKTLRSHVQIKRSMSYELGHSKLLGKTLKQLKLVEDKLWSRHIPDMIGAYFHDLSAVLRGLHGSLRDHGRAYMVVGDSKYAFINVPVAKILVELAPSLGFRIVTSEPFRSMRVSPQQGGQSELLETLVVLEK